MVDTEEITDCDDPVMEKKVAETYLCQICNKNFNNNYELQRHEKRLHSLHGQRTRR